MEAPEGRGRITPLPPLRPDDAGRRMPRSGGQWPPALLALAAVIVFALWLAGTGRPEPESGPAVGSGGFVTLAPLVSDEDPAVPSSATPTTTTSPPLLSELVPWLEGGLIAFSQSREGDRMTFWDAGRGQAQSFVLSSTRTISVQPEPASLDFIAYETAGRARALHVGGWQRQEPIFVGSHGFAWDPAGSGTIAWVGTDQVSKETALYMRPPDGEIRRVGDLPGNSWLMGWTDHGLVLAEYLAPPVNLIDDSTGQIIVKQPALTVLRDTEGRVLAQAAAEPLRASRSGRVVAVGTEDALEAAGVSIDVTVAIVPTEIVVLEPSSAPNTAFTVSTIPPREDLADGESIFASDGRWSLSPDGVWVGRTVSGGIRTALVLQRLDTRSLRLIPLPSQDPRSTVGFSQDGQWFFVWTPSTSELIIINPRNGAQFAVPLEANVRLGGAFIRPAA